MSAALASGRARRSAELLGVGEEALLDVLDHLDLVAVGRGLDGLVQVLEGGVVIGRR